MEYVKELSSENIEACPFCGNDHKFCLSRVNEFLFVVCGNRDCQATGPVDLGQSGAIYKWNTRVKEA